MRARRLSSSDQPRGMQCERALLKPARYVESQVVAPVAWLLLAASDVVLCKRGGMQ